MKVKSLKSNTKLIKGHTYDTDWFVNIPNQTGNLRYSTGRINIVGLGVYRVEDFTQVDGSKLPAQSYDIRKPIEPRVTIDKLKVGEIIVCNSDVRFKYLIRGGKYRISEICIKNGTIKLEGYNRWLNWSNWLFRKLSTQESRDLSLSQIFDREENFTIEHKRKFEQLKNNKDAILISALAKSILDRNRHHLDVTDWCIDKSAKSYKLNRSDFDHLLNKPLSEILSIIENIPNDP